MFISNQKGGVYLMALMVSSAIGGAYFYVTNHFQSKLSLVDEQLSHEHYHNLKRELSLSLSDPQTCMSAFGDNFTFGPNDIKDAYVEPEAPRLEEDQKEENDNGGHQEEKAPLTLSEFSLPVLDLDTNNNTTPPTDQPRTAFAPYSHLKLNNIQLAFPTERPRQRSLFTSGLRLDICNPLYV